MKDLKASLYITVHGSKKSAEQLADDCGISASYLYRACLDGESGCRFPLDLLIPLMNATKDFRVLDHLNSRCSRVTVSLPRVARLNLREPQVINEIQKNFNAVMAAVLEFFEEPNPDKLPQLKEEIHKHLCEIASLKRAVERFEQREMFSA